jgi:hypothetical protein
MKKLSCFIIALVLAGCAARQTPTFDNYGNQAYLISCPRVTRQACIDQAYKTCAHGYYLVDEDDKSSVIFNSITVRCKV